MLKTIHSMSLIIFLSLTAIAHGEIQSLGTCALTSGEIIDDCRIAYRTLGKLNVDKSNIMIVPSWLGGNADDFITSDYAGGGKLADSDKYYVIIIEAFGSGNSSSPSNSPTQRNDNFPDFTIEDIINAQHRLLLEHLDIKHVSTILGVSLGASQTYAWMSKFPNFMDKAVIITGTPQPTTADKLSYRLAIDAVSGLLKLNDGGKAARDFAVRFETHMAWTSNYFAKEIPTDTFDDFDRNKLKTTPLNPYDYRAQTTALMNGDITAIDGDDITKTAARLKMPFITFSHPLDGYINPLPSIKLAAQANQPHIELQGNCGHYSPDCEMDMLKAAVHKFLK